ncbi:hypothetical protein BCT69_18965 [Enterovibrio norvegicus]|nr:hypothetical protein BCT69_18965 [Enterovibrio norvegicus]
MLASLIKIIKGFSMNDEYVERVTEIITVADFYKDYLYPENLMIQFERSVKAKPYDIGCLCFSEREGVLPGWDSGKKIKSKKVNLKSLMKNRRKLIINVLDDFYNSGQREHSNVSKLNHLQRFIDWCDLNGFSDFIENEYLSIEAYKSYTDYLYERVVGSCTLNAESARQQQSGVHYFFKVFYPEKAVYLKSKADIIQFHRESKPAPDDDSFLKYVSAVIPIARNLRYSLMNHCYPLIINGNDYEVILLPCNGCGIQSPFCDIKHSMFNIEEKRFYTEDEYLEVMGKKYRKLGISTSNASWKRDYLKTIDYISFSSKNKRKCFYRRIWAQKVIRLYAKIIQILTGMNTSDLISLEYLNALDVISDCVSKELVTVKFRASGREVRYSLHKKGVEFLKEYMEFLNWYLDGREIEYLFFTDIDSSGRACEPVALRGDFDSRLFKQISGKLIDKKIVNITPTMARKFKSVMLKHLGVSKKNTAVALNHSEGVNERYYSKPSHKTMKIELSSFWGAVKESAKKTKIVDTSIETTSTERSTTVGHCDSFGYPEPKIKNPTIAPDCNKQFGCLYCSNYIFHADDDDIHKLFSLSYVVSAVREFSSDINEADDFFRDLSVRAEYIIREVGERYPSLMVTIDTMRHRVYELGVLTPFWESRLSRYEEIGVII